MSRHEHLERSIPGTSADPKAGVALTVNGVTVTREVSTRMLLSDFIRHSLRLTGTHVGCEHGVCGACTVMIDGRSARSCLTLAVQAEGADIRTIESEAKDDGSLSALQQAFQECHGLQCGYCTPGMIMSAVNLLQDNPSPDEQQIRDGIGGNFCRCTGYQHIVNAIQNAAKNGGGKALRQS